MSSLSDYDDLAGLEFGEFDEIINMQMLQEMGLSGLAGAGAILITTYGAQYLAKKAPFLEMKPVNRARALSVVAVVGGVAASRGLYNYQREASLGVAGGVIGLALANFVGTFFEANPLGAPLGEATDGDGSMLADYDYSTINGLAEANVETGDPAFQRLGASLQGAVVNQESLQGYAPYLS